MAKSKACANPLRDGSTIHLGNSMIPATRLNISLVVPVSLTSPDGGRGWQHWMHCQLRRKCRRGLVPEIKRIPEILTPILRTQPGRIILLEMKMKMSNLGEFGFCIDKTQLWQRLCKTHLDATYRNFRNQSQKYPAIYSNIEKDISQRSSNPTMTEETFVIVRFDEKGKYYIDLQVYKSESFPVSVNVDTDM